MNGRENARETRALPGTTDDQACLLRNGRFAWFVGVGIAIGVAIAIVIGSELKRTEMRDGASCSILDCDCDLDSDSDPDRTACRNGRPCQDRTAVGRGFNSH